MRYDPDLHHRRSIRLRGYDYRQAGAYFVTLCAFQRECLFGEMVDDQIRLSPVGRTVQACWYAIPEHFPGVGLDLMVVMPNHLHGVILLDGSAQATNPVPPSPACPKGTSAGSLAAVVQNLKAVSTRRVNQERGTSGWQVWQRGYYEHSIRNEEEANRVRAYILANPVRWAEDRENPALGRRTDPSS